jgi:fluoride exporter
VTASVALAVALGAALGAPLRYVVERRLAAAWPWGTWTVNVVGSVVLGGLLGAVAAGATEVEAWPVVLVGVGFCGSLTTFGGFAAQVLDLAAGAGTDRSRGRAGAAALAYAGASVLVCVALAWAAYVTVESVLT